MAYATIAGLPVQVGLYVATVPMLVYALSGTSRPPSPPPIHPLRVMNPGPVRRHHERASGLAAGER